MLIVDGTKFDVHCHISDLEEGFEKLSTDNSGRTQSGKMYISLIGVYFNYKMTISRKTSCSLADYDALFDMLSAPVAFNTIEVPHGQGIMTFEAYITKGCRKLLRKYRDEHYWGPITLSFVARSPQLIPGGGSS